MKIQFIKSVTGYAYAKGMQADLPDKMAQALVEQGAAFKIGSMNEPISDGRSDIGSMNEPISDLPSDFPAREILIKEGLVTMAQVREAAATLKDIKGIGKKTVAEIVERLK